MTRAKRKQHKQQQLEAFEAIVSEYESCLLRYATTLLGNTDAAQDVVQDTFIKLFKFWQEDLQPSPQLSGWLYRVAHNCAIDHLRKRSRLHALHLKHAEDRPDFQPPDRGRLFHISDAAQEAVEALHKLSPREQQLVILKVHEEKSYKEISDITGLTVSNVGYILHHAMKKMAAILKKETAT